MDFLWYVFFFFLILILLIIFSKVKINLLVNKQAKNDFIEVKILLFFGLIKYQKRIPLIIFESLDEGIKYQSETNISGMGDTKTKIDRITEEKYKKWSFEFEKILKHIKDLYAIIKKFLRHVQLEIKQWETQIGTGDAMSTAIIVGVAWELKGIFLGLSSKYMLLNENPNLIVKPDFNNQVLNSRFECIFSFRVGYFIVTGIRLLIKYIQGGEKNGRRTASHTRLNENSYGKS